MKKAPVLIAFAIAVLTAAGPQAAGAAGPCDLTPQAAELYAIQTDTSLDELEQLKAEILARRKLLGAAIDCDQAEIAARVDALGSLPDRIKSVEAHGNILKSLAEASRYYEEQKVSIQNLGLWDLKSSSRGIAAWRQATYIPLVTWADNFLLWADNQQFLEKASERLTQVSHVAFSLKLVNQDEINDLFKKARGNFETAFAENDRAKKALDQGRAGIALTHTKNSLKALADTYQIFFELQEALQKIVK